MHRDTYAERALRGGGLNWSCIQGVHQHPDWKKHLKCPWPMKACSGEKKKQTKKIHIGYIWLTPLQIDFKSSELWAWKDGFLYIAPGSWNQFTWHTWNCSFTVFYMRRHKVYFKSTGLLFFSSSPDQDPRKERNQWIRRFRWRIKTKSD